MIWTLSRRDLAPGPPVAQRCDRCGTTYRRLKFAPKRPDPCPWCRWEAVSAQMAQDRALCGVRG